MPKSSAFPQEDTDQPKPLRICTCSSASEDTSETHFTRMQTSIQTVVTLPGLYRDLDHHILTVRPLEAISGSVRVAGVVSRFRALESCNITASISYKTMYRTTGECDSLTALDSVLENPTTSFKC